MIQRSVEGRRRQILPALRWIRSRRSRAAIESGVTAMHAYLIIGIIA